MVDVPKWLDIAYHELGVSEIPGIGSNKRIIQYHSTTTLQAELDEVPWCSSFVNWCMKSSMIKGTNSAAARSWLSWGYDCAEKMGAIVILKRGTNEKHGHVGFAVSFTEDHVEILGGNQKNKVCIQKFNKSDILGMKWPFKIT